MRVLAMTRFAGHLLSDCRDGDGGVRMGRDHQALSAPERCPLWPMQRERGPRRSFSQ